MKKTKATTRRNVSLLCRTDTFLAHLKQRESLHKNIAAAAKPTLQMRCLLRMLVYTPHVRGQRDHDASCHAANFRGGGPQPSPSHHTKRPCTEHFTKGKPAEPPHTRPKVPAPLQEHSSRTLQLTRPSHVPKSKLTPPSRTKTQPPAHLHNTDTAARNFAELQHGTSVPQCNCRTDVSIETAAPTGTTHLYVRQIATKNVLLQKPHAGGPGTDTS